MTEKLEVLSEQEYKDIVQKDPELAVSLITKLAHLCSVQANIINLFEKEVKILKEVMPDGIITV